MNGAIRLLAWTLALLLVALPLVAVVNGWVAADHWPIQRLRLTAEYQRVSAEQVRAAVAPQLGRGFFALDLDEVRAAVAGLPWVEQVEVRKRWPDVLEVILQEHRAYARWGADRLLSDRGLLFSATGQESLQGLPELEGPDARVADVVALHTQAQRIFTGTGLSVLGVRLSARGSWSLALSNGARIVVGRAEPEPRLERLVSVLPQLLSGEPRPFERIDLRYTNGFAVRWVEAPAEGEAGDPVPAPAADAPTRAGSAAARPADPNPESRLPNPGFTT
jgi:cell division protein FtsQ